MVIGHTLNPHHFLACLLIDQGSVGPGCPSFQFAVAANGSTGHHHIFKTLYFQHLVEIANFSIDCPSTFQWLDIIIAFGFSLRLPARWHPDPTVFCWNRKQMLMLPKLTKCFLENCPVGGPKKNLIVDLCPFYPTADHIHDPPQRQYAHRTIEQRNLFWCRH